MKGKRTHLVGLVVAAAMILPLLVVTAAPAIEVLTEEEIDQIVEYVYTL